MFSPHSIFNCFKKSKYISALLLVIFSSCYALAAVTLSTPKPSAVDEYGRFVIDWTLNGFFSQSTLEENNGDGVWRFVDNNLDGYIYEAVEKAPGTYLYRISALDVSSWPPQFKTSASVSVTVKKSNPQIVPNRLAYRYDALGRLTYVEDDINDNRDYDYDAAGNRTQVTKGISE